MISVLKIWVFYNANCRAKAPIPYSHLRWLVMCHRGTPRIDEEDLLSNNRATQRPHDMTGVSGIRKEIWNAYTLPVRFQAYDFTSYNSSSLKGKEVVWPCMPAENAEAGRVTCHLWHDQQRSCTIYSFTSTSFTAPGTWSVFASSGADASWPAEGS